MDKTRTIDATGVVKHLRSGQPCVTGLVSALLLVVALSSCTVQLSQGPEGENILPFLAYYEYVQYVPVRCTFPSFFSSRAALEVVLVCTATATMPEAKHWSKAKQPEAKQTTKEMCEEHHCEHPDCALLQGNDKGLPKNAVISELAMAE